MNIAVLLSALSLLCTWSLCLGARMESLYSWSTLDFTFPSTALRDVYLAGGRFTPQNNIILDVDVWNGAEGASRKVFVTLPKFKPGIPVTLATVTDQRRHNVTLLEPYPDWTWHQGDCDGITSVYRTSVDECGRLWVLDTGVVDSFVDYKRVCSPQVLIFDLQTNELIKRYRFPDSILDHESLLISIVVDIRNHGCSSSFAYIADVNEYNLYVYDFFRNRSWRITNNLFYPYPFHGDFHINGVNFELMDGIFGLALGPIKTNGDRTLYFHSFASIHESWVSTSVLRNSSLFEDDAGASPRSFHVFEETRSSQSAAQAMTDSGVLLYTLVEENAIACWNSRLPFRKQNLDIIAKDSESLQFQSGLKVFGNYVWTVSNRLQNYISGKVTDNDINMRINVGRISDLLRRTKCEVRQRPTSGSISTLVFPTIHTSTCADCQL